VTRGVFTAATGLAAAELNDCFDPPRCRLTKSGTQSIANNTTTAVTFDVEDIDDGGMHSTTTNTSRITIPTGGGGTYLIGAHAEFAQNATGIRTLLLVVNGTSTQSTVRDNSPSGSNATRLACTTLVSLVAGDYVEAQVVQTSGGNLNVAATCNLWACWVAI
jgi:hypothetical protein